MAFRLYIVPVAGTGTITDPRRPKYFSGTGRIVAVGQSWAGMDYGAESWFMVGADLSTADDALVVAQADVIALPFNLNANLTTPQVNTTQTRLEAANIPAGWVTTALTWSQVVRTVLGVFSFLQRYAVIYHQETGNPAPTLYTGGATLNTTYGSLPLAVRTALLSTAQSFNMPTTGLTAGTTIRAILKAMADEFQNRPYIFGGTVV